MARALRFTCGVFVATAAILAAAGAAPFQIDADVAARIPAAVDAQLHVTTYSVQSLALPAEPGPSESVLVNLDGVSHALELERTSLRSPRFQLLVQNAAGEIESVEPPTPRTYRGRAITFGQSSGDGSLVSASLLESGLRARIVTPAGSFVIQPLSDALAGAPPDLHVVYRAEDVEHLEFECGTTGEQQIGAANAGAGPFGQGGASSGFGTQPAGTVKVAEIAYDCDFEFYTANGSSISATVADVEDVTNDVDAIYRSEVSIAYEITAILVRTAEPDPYTSLDASALLTEFVNYWSSQYSTIPRDTAHLMTGRAVNGNTIGIAYVGAVCSSGFGYGLSESRFTSNVVYRASLTAHELGHNWNSQHCNTQGDCAIMCSSIGGCNGLSTFAVQDETSINGWKNAVGCLGTEPAPLASPFLDPFASTIIDANSWTWIKGAIANAAGVGIPSGTYALNLDAAGTGPADDDEIRTNAIDLSGAPSTSVMFAAEHRGVENGERLVADGYSNAGHWVELASVTSNGVDQSTFTTVSATLPASMMHAGFRLRLRVEGNETNDDWYVDDVSVGPSGILPPVVSIAAAVPAQIEIGVALSVSATCTDPDSSVATVVARLTQGASTLVSTSLSGAGSTWTGTLSTVGLAEQTAMLEVEATDGQGHSTTASQPVLVFDRPVLSAAGVTPGVPDAGDALAVSVAITDSSGVASAQAVLKKGATVLDTQPLVFDAMAGAYLAAFAATGHSGAYVVVITATDTLTIDATPEVIPVVVVVEPLALTSVLPPSGSTQGGTLITLQGGGFTTDVAAGSLRVYADGVACTQVSADSNTQLQARTPALAAGLVDLEVRATKLGAKLTAQLPGAFTAFDPPTIAGISPASGSALAGAVVVVSGSHFQDDVLLGTTVVTIGSTVADAVDVLDDSTIVARFDGGGDDAGVDDVVVENSRGHATLAHAFTWTSVGFRVRAEIPVPAPVAAFAAAATSGAFSTSIVLGMPSAGAGGELAAVDLTDDSLTALPAPPVAFAAFGRSLLELGTTSDPSGLAIRVGAPDTIVGATGGAISAVATGVDTASVLEDGLVAGAEFGAALTPLADTDADGAIDVWAAGLPGLAHVQVFANTAPGNEADLAPIATDSRLGARLAHGRHSAGHPLLLATAPDADPLGLANAGSAVLFRVDLAAGAASATQLFRFDGDAAGDAYASPFEMACLVPGDLDGDGMDEAVVSFPGANGRGAVRAYASASGAILWTSPGEFAGDAFGAALARVPDVDGDGIPDLVVGAPGADAPPDDDVGAIYVVSGRTGAPLARIAHSVADARLGAELGVFADRDGDLMFEVLAATRAASGADAVVVLTVDPRSFCKRAFAGDRMKGSLRDAEERDGLWHGMVEDETIGWTITGSTALDPFVAVVLDADGSLLLSSDPASPAFDPLAVVQQANLLRIAYTSAAVRDVCLVIADPGMVAKRSYQVRSRRMSASTVTLDDTLPLDGSGSVVSYTFGGSALARLSGTAFASDHTIALTIDEIETPSGLDLRTVAPKAFVTANPAYAIKVKPKKLTLPETGMYSFDIDPAAGATGDLDVHLTLKLRRGTAKLKD